jgi:ABC-2 type transport system permease protein
MRKTWAVIRREFVERVRTKWFWISAILGPVFFAAIIVVPVLLSRSAGVRRIAIVDGSSTEFGARVVKVLSGGRSFRAHRVVASPGIFDSLTAQVEAKQLDGFLIVTDDLTETGRAEYRASNVSSIQAIEELQRALSRLVVKVRLEREGVNPAVVDRAQIAISLETKKISRGETRTESAGGSFFMAYIMAVLLFMAILLYGVNVMSSVLEEKNNRIMEVLVSSLKPFEMMLGKVLGVGAVSFFQFLIWGVSARVLFSQRQALLRTMTGTADASAGFQMPPIPLATIAVFMAFFLGGFLLYSAMFAAVGAMSGNEQEARQAQQPVMYLLMVSYLSIFALTNDPNSAFSTGLSLVPFTSPIAMPVRWTAGNLPFTEVLASLAILFVAIMGVTWVAARIYRIGILMTGKRPNLKELIRWVRAA